MEYWIKWKKVDEKSVEYETWVEVTGWQAGTCAGRDGKPLRNVWVAGTIVF